MFVLAAEGLLVSTKAPGVHWFVWKVPAALTLSPLPGFNAPDKIGTVMSTWNVMGIEYTLLTLLKKADGNEKFPVGVKKSRLLPFSYVAVLPETITNL